MTKFFFCNSPKVLLLGTALMLNLPSDAATSYN